jgi:hypothetical protein
MLDGILDERLKDENRDQQPERVVVESQIDGQPILEPALLQMKIAPGELQLLSERDLLTVVLRQELPEQVTEREDHLQGLVGLSRAQHRDHGVQHIEQQMRANLEPQRLELSFRESCLELERLAIADDGPTSTMALAGRSGGHAYFFSSSVGRYVTSSYFRDAYPGWVDRFNRQALPTSLNIASWDLVAPAGALRLARRDAAGYEADGIHTTFPHRFRDETEASAVEDPAAFARWFSGTPMLDEATLALASTAVDALRLGDRGVVDYLGVNVSSLDDVGHAYGPMSVEQLDALLRLDRALGSLFARLDESVGVGGYLVALTADHGVANVPEFEQEHRRPGRRIDRQTLDRLIDAAVIAAGDRDAGPGDWRERVAERLEQYDFVADVMTTSELGSDAAGDPFIALYRNSFRPDRVVQFPVRQTADGASLAPLGLIVRFTEGTIPDYAPAVHGSPYLYDRHVPLLFMGPGVEPGVSDEPVRTVDVAPTLAALAGIPPPSGLDGRPLRLGRQPQAGKW